MGDPVTAERIARLRHLHQAATAGPWGWRGNDDGLVELRGHGPYGRLDGRVVSAQRSEPCIVTTHDEEVVLTFEACDDCKAKWAEMLAEGHTDMWEGYRCPKPENLATVWLKGEHAIEPANKWAVREQTYRSDVARVDHPDAALIAEARNALPDLLDEIERLRTELAGAPDEGPVEQAVVEALIEVGGWDEIDGDGDPASILAQHVRALPDRLADAADTGAGVATDA